MKHRVKVQYTVDIEAKSQDGAIRIASYNIPSADTTAIHIECWTPKQMVEIKAPSPVPVGDTTDVSQGNVTEALPEPAYPAEV